MEAIDTIKTIYFFVASIGKLGFFTRYVTQSFDQSCSNRQDSDNEKLPLNCFVAKIPRIKQAIYKLFVVGNQFMLALLFKV